MPSPDERDTAIDHDVVDGAPGADRWSPGGSPPAPGWYEDPWNATALRRWDGSQWTGETAGKGSTPDAPASETFVATSMAASGPSPTGDAPTPAKHRPARRLPNPFIVGGIVVALVVVGVVVMTSGHTSSTTSATTAAPSPLPTVAKPVGLSGSVLTAADLGAGWTAAPPAHALTAPEYTAGPCGSSLWSHNVAGYESSLVNGASAETAHGAVVTMVYEASSLSDATAQQAVLAAPAYAACLKQQITSEVRSQLPKGSGQSVTTVSVTPFSLSLAIPSKAYVVSVTVSGPGAATHQVTVNAVALFSGRYLATVDVSSSSDAPLSGQIVQLQAANEATRLAALG